MYLIDPKVTDDWFVSTITIKPSGKKPSFLPTWKKYAEQEVYWGNGPIHFRIEQILFRSGDITEYSSRLATTMILWLSDTNIGNCIVQKILGQVNSLEYQDVSALESLAIMSWANENKREKTGRFTRILEKLLQRDLTALDFEVAECVWCWVVSEEGRVLFAEHFLKIGWPVTWKVPTITIREM